MNSNNLDRLNNALSGTSSRRQALKLMGGSILGGAAMAAGIKGAIAQGGPAGSQRGPTGGPGSLVNVIDPVYYTDVDYIDTVEITRFSQKGGELTASGNVYQGKTFISTFSAPVPVDMIEVTDGSELESNVNSRKLASAATGRTSDVSLAQLPARGPGECQVLYLTLGPLYLDVLGLVIEIPNPIILDIYAVEGGGLLGDLLCAVAGLLDGGGPLQQITGLLNQILGILSGL